MLNYFYECKYQELRTSVILRKSRLKHQNPHKKVVVEEECWNTTTKEERLMRQRGGGTEQLRIGARAPPLEIKIPYNFFFEKIFLIQKINFFT